MGLSMPGLASLGLPRRELQLAVTGPDGHYRLGQLSPGELTLRFEREGFASLERQVTLEENPAREPPIEDAILEPTAVISGLVTDASTGTPVGEFTARLLVDWLDKPVYDRLEDVRARGTSGAFEVRDVPPGAYRLRVAAQGYVPSEAPLKVAGGEAASVRITLDPGCSVAGTVTGLDGTLLEGAKVTLRPAEEVDVPRSFRVDRSCSTSSDGAGAFRLDGLLDGEYEVTASAPGYAPWGPVKVRLAGGRGAEAESLAIHLEPAG